jgi:hypothetical protein
VIPEAKIVALREALERDGTVTFKNGSTIEWSAAQTGPEGEQVEGRLVVKRGHGGETRYTEDEIRRAYEMALNGPRPKQQPSGDGSKFGDGPPW